MIFFTKKPLQYSLAYKPKLEANDLIEIYTINVSKFWTYKKC